jgi:hypothetical protein
MKKLLERLNKFHQWWIIPFLAVAAILFGMSSKTPMWMDEYEMYRLSNELPNYSSTANFFLVDRPSTLALPINGSVDKVLMQALQSVYNSPIYTHSPLVPILVSPVVKGLNWLADKGVIPHIEAQKGLTKCEIVPAEVMTQILRIIPIALFLLSLYLIFKMMYKKVGNHAYLMWIPILVGIVNFEGAFLFYWDIFMMFFLVLTLYIQEVHPDSKWKYVTACCLVNTKMWVGIAFLLPIIIIEIRRNWRTSWKMMLTVLSIVPFWIATVVVTHDPIYLWSHYWATIPVHNYIYTLIKPSAYFGIFMTEGMYVYVAILVMLLLKFPKHLEYATFIIMAIVYEWGNTLTITYLPALLLSTALAMPIVSCEYNLIERGKKWLGLGMEKSEFI